LFSRRSVLLTLTWVITALAPSAVISIVSKVHKIMAQIFGHRQRNSQNPLYFVIPLYTTLPQVFPLQSSELLQENLKVLLCEFVIIWLMFCRFVAMQPLHLQLLQPLGWKSSQSTDGYVCAKIYWRHIEHICKTNAHYLHKKIDHHYFQFSLGGCVPTLRPQVNTRPLNHSDTSTSRWFSSWISACSLHSLLEDDHILSSSLE